MQMLAMCCKQDLLEPISTTHWSHLWLGRSYYIYYNCIIFSRECA